MDIEERHEYRYLESAVLKILRLLYLLDDDHFAVSGSSNPAAVSCGPAPGLAEEADEEYGESGGNAEKYPV